MLLAHCLIVHPSGLEFLRKVVSEHGVHDNTVDLLITILASERQAEEHTPIFKYAAETIFSNLTTSSYVRDQVKSFTHWQAIEYSWVTGPLLRVVQRSKADDDDITMTAATSLTRIMEQLQVDGSMDDFIKYIVQELDGMDRSDTVCNVLGTDWRCAAPRHSKETLACLLESICKTMFASPTSIIALNLFGSVVGTEMDDDIDTDRLIVALQRVVRCCSLEMSNNKSKTKAIFERLAPLLLLRRISATMFSFVRKHDYSQIRHDLDRLTDVLADRFEVGEDASLEERRLAAEVAGRCLSFGEPRDTSGSCSMFCRICEPAFVSFLRTLDIHSMKQARAALYAVYHHLSFHGDECFDGNDDPYLSTASFAFHAITIDSDSMDPETSKEMIQLQTGCIEFFAFCIELTMKLPAPTIISSSPANESWDAIGNELQDADKKFQGCFSAYKSLPQISKALVVILQFGTCNDEWVWSMKRRFLCPATCDATIEFLPSSQICLWNALILVSQRCSQEKDILGTFAKWTLPWVADWLTVKTKEHDIACRHPLCLAAAFQVILILVTRTKSLKGFDARDDTIKQERIHKVCDFAMQMLVQNNGSVVDTDNDYYATKSLRTSALKLLMAIITVDQMDSKASSLCSVDKLRTILILLEKVANTDPDSELQQLVRQFLTYLGNP